MIPRRNLPNFDDRDRDVDVDGIPGDDHGQMEVSFPITKLRERSLEVPSTYEANELLAEYRLRALYPMLADNVNTKLPTLWNCSDMHESLTLDVYGLRVKFIGAGETEQSIAKENSSNAVASGVRANRSIPTCCGFYYYEVTVVESSSGCVGVGLCDKNVNIGRLPGWDKNSYGYHGDDGNFFCAHGTGVKYGPRYGTGDVVGCGYNMITKTIFFTKNGANLGVAKADVSQSELYPMVGLKTKNEAVDVNFGQKPFVFDLTLEIQKIRISVAKAIIHTPLPQEKSLWSREIVSNWLEVNGFTNTMTVFNKSVGLTSSEPIESITLRKEIWRYIMDHRPDEALSSIEKSFPHVFQQHPELRLILRSQHFVELVRRYTFEFPEIHQGDAPANSTNGCSTSNTAVPATTEAQGNGTATAPRGSSTPNSKPLISRPTKRARSEATSLNSSSDSDVQQPPVRRTPNEYDFSLVRDEPSTSKNGCSNSQAGNGVCKDRDRHRELEQVLQREEGKLLQRKSRSQCRESCSRRRQRTPIEGDQFLFPIEKKELPKPPEHMSERATRATELIEWGRSLRESAKKIHLRQDIAAYVELALNSLCYSKHDFSAHPLLKKRHLEEVARKCNYAILGYNENHDSITNRRTPITFEKLLDLWETSKEEMVHKGLASVHFAMMKEMIFYVPFAEMNSSDSEYESDDDDGASDSSYTTAGDEACEPMNEGFPPPEPGPGTSGTIYDKA